MINLSVSFITNVALSMLAFCSIYLYVICSKELHFDTKEVLFALKELHISWNQELHQHA